MSNGIECGIAGRLVEEYPERIAAAGRHLEAGGADVFELTLCVPSDGLEGEAFQPARTVRFVGPRGSIQAAARVLGRLALRIAAELQAEREAELTAAVRLLHELGPQLAARQAERPDGPTAAVDATAGEPAGDVGDALAVEGADAGSVLA